MEIKQELIDFVKQTEFAGVEEELRILQQQTKRFAKRDEINSRLQLIQVDLSDKLSDKVTKSSFKKLSD